MIRKDSEVIEDYTVTNEKWSVWFEESTAAHGEKQELVDKVREELEMKMGQLEAKRALAERNGAI